MIEKIQKTSWKTTLAGVLAAIAFASSELEAAFSGDEADWGQIASALTIALRIGRDPGRYLIAGGRVFLLLAKAYRRKTPMPQAEIEKHVYASRAWMTMFKISVPVIYGLMAALIAAVIAHEVRVSVIESNRFTDEDAYQMETRMMELPKWHLDDIGEIKVTLKSIDTRLRAIENSR
jgi:hypothetical protein